MNQSILNLMLIFTVCIVESCNKVFKKTKQKQSNKATTHACVYVCIKSPKSGPGGPWSKVVQRSRSTAMAHERGQVEIEKPLIFAKKSHVKCPGQSCILSRVYLISVQLYFIF